MIQSPSLVHPLSRKTGLPPLEPGDHLSRAEFERRYDAMPGLKKAELIEGVVHMPSPVRWKQHAEPHALIMLWLGAFAAHTPFTSVGDNGSIRLDNDNMPQPDAAMIIVPTKGGQAHFSDDGYLEGAPELIVEVAASTASIDLNTKLRVYRRSNVLEYVVWRVLDGVVDWFHLENGEYHRLAPGQDGIVRSLVFPGLWLDVAALVALDSAKVLDTLGQGLADPTHRTFVAKFPA